MRVGTYVSPKRAYLRAGNCLLITPTRFNVNNCVWFFIQMTEDIETFEKDGEMYGRDEHGEFKLSAGSVEPVEDRCQAVLKFTMKRYGETRYCTALPEKRFVSGGSRFCKHHKSREELNNQQMENYETAAFVKNYFEVFNYLEPHKQVTAIELFEELLDDSTYDFEVAYASHEVDTSEADWWNFDVLEVEFPVPYENKEPAKALWLAVLHFIMAENVSVKIFKDAYQSDAQAATGEREQVVASGEHGPVKDMAEHHLNLPLSRMIKDHSHLLKMGGIGIDDEEDTTQVKQWVLNVGPDDNKPESDKGEDPFESNVSEDTGE